MVLAAAGIGMMGLGTAANLYGTYTRDKATKRALKDYQNAVNQKAAQDRAALMEEQGVLSGLSRERQQGIGSYIQQLGQAQYPPDDQGFRQRQGGALTDIGKMTGGMQSNFAYSGAPRTQAENQQGALTGLSNDRLGRALLADYTVRQIDEREKGAGNRLALGELMRGTKGKSIQERMQLARALRDLDWQKKTAAMQNNLDRAGQQGQWFNVLGGLGTQLGSMATMYGLANPGTPNFGGNYDINSPGALDMTTVNPGQV